MSRQSARQFEKDWDQLRVFSFPELDRPKTPAPEPDYCLHARDFDRWASDLVAKAQAARSFDVIDRAIAYLVKKYFSLRPYAEQDHLSPRGNPNHLCIDDVFHAQYQRLQRAEADLRIATIEQSRDANTSGAHRSVDDILISELV